MTTKEKQNYNQMREALIRITKYQTPKSMRKDAKKDWGVSFEEALEMAYENIQQEAKSGIKGVRALS